MMFDKIKKVLDEKVIGTILECVVVASELSTIAVFFTESQFGNESGKSKLVHALGWLKDKLEKLGYLGLDNEMVDALLKDIITAKHQELKSRGEL